MDRLACLSAFVAIVDKGGFAAAARHLNLAPATITQQIQSLEQHLGVRLLNRTTRRCRPTEAGKAYYERCTRILEDIREAEAVVSTLHSTLSGTLRLNTSPTLAHHVSSLIGEYVAMHERTTFDLTITDHMGGLVEDGFDLAIRADALPESRLVGRRLGYAHWSPCAAPLYLARYGEPRQPADLAPHNCLIYAPYWDRGEWRFADGSGGEQAVRISGNLRSNDPQAIRTAALAGQGLAFLPDMMIEADLAAGRLIRILEGYSVAQAAVHAVFPTTRQLPLKVRSFIDFAVQRFGKPPRQGHGHGDLAAMAESQTRAHAASPAPFIRNITRLEMVRTNPPVGAGGPRLLPASDLACAAHAKGGR